MEKEPDWLLKYKNNINSQAGEDGIIKKILEIIPENDQWCVEFGAWDGIYLSNVRSLIKQQNYSAILIEGSKKKHEELTKNYSEYKNIITLNEFVGYSKIDNLDNILKDTPIPKDFDFLSIDVDGNDYHIWNAMSEYSPKLVCIEFNPTIPTEVKFIQAADPSVNQGNSLLALVELAKQKGYELVSVLPWNAFFVKAEYFSLFGITDNSPIALRKSLDAITYMFVGFDGRVILNGNSSLLWHGIKIKNASVQQLPKFLQKYPGNYTKIENFLFHIYRSYTKRVAKVTSILSKQKN